MAWDKTYKSFFTETDFTKAMANFQSAPFDFEEVAETQRKNVQAMAEAQQMTLNLVQSLLQRQTQIMTEIAKDNSQLIEGMMKEGTPESKITENAKILKKMYERTVKNMNDLSAMINESGAEASGVINKRVTATLNEIEASLEKSQTAKAA